MTVEKQKILIVDDEVNNHRGYQKVLAQFNLEIHEALSGQKALEVAHLHDFFLILMDVQMPDMDGFETASIILGHPKTEHIPVIFITANAKDDGFEFKGYKCGAVDYMTKPIKEEVLQSKVSVFMELHNNRKELEQEKNNARLAQAKAEEASNAKSRFLANMSHEIRTPMNGILGTINLLIEGVEPSEQRDLLEMARHSGHSLLTIINDILDLSKLEAGKVTLEKLAIDLKLLINDVVSLLENSAHEKNINLKVSYPSEHMLYIGDSTRIRQIILNLLSNAIKFTERGSVELKLQYSSINQNEHIVIFHIIDSGIGIPQDKVDSIFQSFTQADVSTTRKFGGTGLGMTISKQLAKLMKGDLTLKSILGEGSHFTLRIPMEFTEEKYLDMKLPNENLSRNYNKKVLLAEDNKINKTIAVKTLKKLGLTVDAVENGKLAVNQFNQTYDLVLMDMQMPVLDGLEATRILIENDCKKPIVAMTANAMEEHVKQCEESGMVGFISKPFKVKDLVFVLDKYLL